MSSTPGPWFAEKGLGCIDVMTQDGDIVAFGNSGLDENEANMHLIAAAPTMVEYIRKKAQEGDADAQSILVGIGV